MESSFNSFLYVWLALAVITFISLFFIAAPYGRHNRRGWGPQLDNKWGWVVMELVSPLALSVFFFMANTHKNQAVWTFYLLWMLHYTYRSLYFPFKINTKGKTIPLSIVLMAIFFNSVNGGTNGYFFGTHPQFYDNYSFTSSQFVVGVSLFVLGFLVHFTSDHILIGLRKTNDEYVVPNRFLFKYVASPNYLGEIVEWLGFAILTNALSAWCFWAWTVANLFPRAVANYKWYKSKFKNYPKNRKALIPFVY